MGGPTECGVGRACGLEPADEFGDGFDFAVGEVRSERGDDLGWGSRIDVLIVGPDPMLFPPETEDGPWPVIPIDALTDTPYRARTWREGSRPYVQLWAGLGLCRSLGGETMAGGGQ